MKFKELTAALIMVLMCTGLAFGDLIDGLVAYYPFNGNANDESGYGNHGNVSGATLVQDRFGGNNSAFSFDGMDDNINGDSSIDLSSNTITISSWVKTDGSTTVRFPKMKSSCWQIHPWPPGPQEKTSAFYLSTVPRLSFFQS